MFSKQDIIDVREGVMDLLTSVKAAYIVQTASQPHKRTLQKPGR